MSTAPEEASGSGQATAASEPAPAAPTPAPEPYTLVFALPPASRIYENDLLKIISELEMVNISGHPFEMLLNSTSGDIYSAYKFMHDGGGLVITTGPNRARIIGFLRGLDSRSWKLEGRASVPLLKAENGRQVPSLGVAESWTTKRDHRHDLGVVGYDEKRLTDLLPLEGV